MNIQRNAKKEIYSQKGGYLVLLIQIQMNKTDAEKCVIWLKSTYCSFDRLQGIQAFTTAAAAASSSFLGSGQTNSFQAVTEHLRQSILQQNETTSAMKS